MPYRLPDTFVIEKGVGPEATTPSEGHVLPVGGVEIQHLNLFPFAQLIR